MMDRKRFLGALGLGALAAKLTGGTTESVAVGSPEPSALPEMDAYPTVGYAIEDSRHGRVAVWIGGAVHVLLAGEDIRAGWMVAIDKQGRAVAATRYPGAAV